MVNIKLIQVTMFTLIRGYRSQWSFAVVRTAELEVEPIPLADDVSEVGKWTYYSLMLQFMYLGGG